MSSTPRAHFPTTPSLAHAEVAGAGCVAADASVTTVGVLGAAELEHPSDPARDDDWATGIAAPVVVAVASPTPDAAVGRLPEPAAFGAILELPRRPLRLHEPAILRERIRFA